MPTILETARTRAGLSQATLAERVGVDRSFISMVERGVKTTSMPVFTRLCVALVLSPEERLEALEMVSDAGAGRKDQAA